MSKTACSTHRKNTTCRTRTHHVLQHERHRSTVDRELAPPFHDEDHTSDGVDDGDRPQRQEEWAADVGREQLALVLHVVPSQARPMGQGGKGEEARLLVGLVTSFSERKLFEGVSVGVGAPAGSVARSVCASALGVVLDALRLRRLERTVVYVSECAPRPGWQTRMQCLSESASCCLRCGAVCRLERGVVCLSKVRYPRVQCGFSVVPVARADSTAQCFSLMKRCVNNDAAGARSVSSASKVQRECFAESISLFVFRVWNSANALELSELC